jgi:hypothetical protein
MFTGNENHRTTLSVAKTMTKRYRDNISDGDKIGGFFGISDVQDLLDQENCVGFRYYYGLNAANEKVLVLVGTDASGEDLVHGLVLDMSLPCPSQCSGANDLNSD